MTSVLYRPMTDSASALSYESPTLPTDGAMPAAASSAPYRIDRYSLPALLRYQPCHLHALPGPVGDRHHQRVQHQAGIVARRGAPPGDQPGEAASITNAV